MANGQKGAAILQGLAAGGIYGAATAGIIASTDPAALNYGKSPTPAQPETPTTQVVTLPNGQQVTQPIVVQVQGPAQPSTFDAYVFPALLGGLFVLLASELS